MRIRRATPAEAEEVTRLINAAFEVEREFRKGDRTSESEVQALMDKETILAAEQDGRLIGVVEVRVRGDTGYFGMLAVDPSSRRGGVGRSLVEAAEDLCS